MTFQSSVVVLKHRSRGPWRPEDFSVEATPVPDPAEGEVLVAARYITVDPYVRAMLDDSSSYGSPVPLGGVPPGDMVAEVVRARAAEVPEGALLVGSLGWRSHAAGRSAELSLLSPGAVDIIGAAGKPAAISC